MKGIAIVRMMVYGACGADGNGYNVWCMCTC